MDMEKVTILGAARSGIAAARLLRDHGAKVFVSDQKPQEDLTKAIDELTRLGIEIETGSHSDRALDADVIVISPGVPTDAPIVQKALALRIPIFSEIEVASWFCKAPIVAVTGSNGKTTTVSLLGAILETWFGSLKGRRVFVKGNIGDAFSTVADEATPQDIVVLEVSSFQLDHIKTFHPQIAILLNITPDHLDRYGYAVHSKSGEVEAFKNYVTSKLRIAMNLRGTDAFIYNADDEIVVREVHRLPPDRGSRFPFRVADNGATASIDRGVLTLRVNGEEEPVLPANEIAIRGLHNLYNSMAASIAAHILGAPIPVIAQVLRTFKGVEHRLEFVREVSGVKFVNDSKGTNVDAVWYALQSFSEPIVLLLGGRDKGNDYSRLVPLVQKHVRAIVAIGESAEKVMTVFSPLVYTIRADSMEEAVRKAYQLSKRGDVVLLSPACASFDWFENYEHRGRVFKELVWSLPEKP